MALKVMNGDPTHQSHIRIMAFHEASTLKEHVYKHWRETFRMPSLFSKDATAEGSDAAYVDCGVTALKRGYPTASFAPSILVFSVVSLWRVIQLSTWTKCRTTAPSAR